MKIIFVRHAEPDYSADSLTPKGFREAALLVPRLTALPHVVGWYCSPLGRAKATAAPTMDKLQKEAEILPFLAEFRANIKDPDTGELRIPWDLKPHWWKNEPAFYDKDRWYTHPLMRSGTVSVEEIYKETCRELDALLARHGCVRQGNMYRCDHNDQRTIVLVCHMTISMMMIGYLTGISPVLLCHGMCMPPSSATTVVTEERQKGLVSFRCFQMGDTSHLAVGGEPPSRMAMFQEVYTGTDHTSTT